MTATTLCIGIFTTTWYGEPVMVGWGGWGLCYKLQVDPPFYCLEFTGIKWIHAQLIKHSLKLQHQSKFIINGATLDLQTDKIQKETFIQRHQVFYLCVISVCFELLTGLVTLFIPVHGLQHPHRTWNGSRERSDCICSILISILLSCLKVLVVLWIVQLQFWGTLQVASDDLFKLGGKDIYSFQSWSIILRSWSLLSKPKQQFACMVDTRFKSLLGSQSPPKCAVSKNLISNPIFMIKGSNFMILSTSWSCSPG